MMKKVKPILFKLVSKGIRLKLKTHGMRIWFLFLVVAIQKNKIKTQWHKNTNQKWRLIMSKSYLMLSLDLNLKYGSITFTDRKQI